MIKAIDHLVIYAADIIKTIKFYQEILELEVLEFENANDNTSRFAIKLGNQKINIHDASAPFEPHATLPLPGTLDICFLSTASINYWQEHLVQHGVPIESGPVGKQGANGPLRQFTFGIRTKIS